MDKIVDEKDIELLKATIKASYVAILERKRTAKNEDDLFTAARQASYLEGYIYGLLQVSSSLRIDLDLFNLTIPDERHLISD